MIDFPVVPICDRQRLDIADTHLLNSGLYRECNTYKAGGGYDQFPEIYRQITGNTVSNIENQFVVQLWGCPLRCPYCYVTKEGVFGKPVKVSAEKLVSDFIDSGCGTFHLMGGAPAIYMEKWVDILKLLSSEIPFHSDFVLCEKEYNKDTLKEIAEYKNGVYAISVKGNKSWYDNQDIDFALVEQNMGVILETDLQYYFTFTGMSEEDINWWKNRFPAHSYQYSFSLPIIEYEALK